MFDIKHDYDVYIVAFSGGKDSLATFLHLLELGILRQKIELWHHSIDGQEGSSLMDWNCTIDYCRAVADAFGVPVYYSWRQGGFEREMLRSNQATASVKFEVPTSNGIEIHSGGGKSKKLGTRLKFPQVSADLSVRWCSAYMKISVMATAINNQERFLGKRTFSR